MMEFENGSRNTLDMCKEFIVLVAIDKFEIRKILVPQNPATDTRGSVNCPGIYHPGFILLAHGGQN